MGVLTKNTIGGYSVKRQVRGRDQASRGRAGLNMVIGRLSIAVVGSTGRRAVGGVTAAFMLLCSVYCACGGLPALPVLLTSEAEPGTSAPCSAHCHDHARTAPEQSEHGGTPRGEQPGHSGCGHCNPVLSILESSSGSAALHTLESAPAWFPLPVSTVEVHSVRSPPSVHGDLPPPASPPTLLSLHCALNT